MYRNTGAENNIYSSRKIWFAILQEIVIIDRLIELVQISKKICSNGQLLLKYVQPRQCSIYAYISGVTRNWAKGGGAPLLILHCEFQPSPFGAFLSPPPQLSDPEIQYLIPGQL